MSAPRGLSAEEAAAWERLAATVTPLVRPAPAPLAEPQIALPASPAAPRAKKHAPPRPGAVTPPVARPPGGGLDSHWERRMKGGAMQPELTLDLHGHTLDSAYERLDIGLAQARAIGVRVVLLIAGKPRPVAAADRAERRGAIRAKLLDWLAAGPHASAIAAIRPAHRRHGGDGALYLILRKPR